MLETIVEWFPIGFGFALGALVAIVAVSFVIAVIATIIELLAP